MLLLEFLETIELALFYAVICVVLVPLALITFLKIKFVLFRHRKSDKNQINVGIFHPYCNAGGDEERVLWTGVKALQSKYQNVKIYIYTGDLDADKDKILSNVDKLFNIKIEDDVTFVYLFHRKWVESKMYPYFTLFCQSFGSIWLGYEALRALQPDVFVDTMGYAFTYPLFKYIGNCQVASYTHYPTISMDVLKHVYRRVVVHNNRRVIARNPFLTASKLLYYKVFIFLYGFVGRTADVVMVNSSWTEDHLNSIWKCPLKTHRVYPPCDIEKLVNMPLMSEEEKGETLRIISVAQFRSEKHHSLMLILRAMYELRSLVNEETWNKIRLVIIGSTHDYDDEVRVKDMVDLSRHLALDDNVEFQLNISQAELMNQMQHGTIDLHAMYNEPFGISVVECMAAGLIMVAHASGGPRTDIVETQIGSQNGFLASDAEDYAEILAYIVNNMTIKERDAICSAARSSVQRFSNENFERDFIRTLEPFFRTE